MKTLIGGIIIGSLLSGVASFGYARAKKATIWNETAAKEAQATMHKLHGAWDTMDIKAVEKAIADDGFLATYEYTDKNEAVTLRTKGELLGWLQKGFDDLKARQLATSAFPRTTMDCRATDDLAVCNEECDIVYKRTDGKLEVTPHRGTSVLRKGPEGWQFTHWHVSEAGPRKVVAANEYKQPAAHIH